MELKGGKIIDTVDTKDCYNNNQPTPRWITASGLSKGAGMCKEVSKQQPGLDKSLCAWNSKQVRRRENKLDMYTSAATRGI